MNFFEQGELILWLPKVTKIKGSKFKLSWEGPYKVQKVYNSNMMELNILSNNDVQRVNINKLKKYHHGEPPIIIMIVVVNIEGRMNIPHLQTYLGLIIKPNQKNLNLNYGIEMMTQMKSNGYQVVS